MIITNGSTPTIVFLLVSAENGTDGMDGLAGSTTVKMSKNGSTLAEIDVSITRLGDGWYSFPLSAVQTDTDGSLIITAKADATLEWRDLHQVITEESTTLGDGDFDRIADHVLRRSFADAWTAGNGEKPDFRSLLGSVAKDVNKVELVGSTLKIYAADDETEFASQTVVADHNAVPIVGIDTQDGADGDVG